MTKLEEAISDAMNEMAENNKTGFGLGLSDYSKVAAEVAKRYIEKAFDAGAEATINLLPEKSIPTDIKGYVEAKHQWLKENGIV